MHHNTITLVYSLIILTNNFFKLSLVQKEYLQYNIALPSIRAYSLTSKLIRSIDRSFLRCET
jgi:hypothetical protein